MQTVLATGAPTSSLNKSTGSDSRSAADASLNDNAQQPVAHQIKNHIGLDAGNEFASVSAETATALNRTVLQSLALALAAKLGIARRSNETMERFFARIIEALEKQLPGDRTLIEARSLLKALKVDLADFFVALKAPDSAAAARLSAIVEEPHVSAQRTALNVANDTYLAGGAGAQSNTDGLGMGQQARSTIEGQNLFSDSSKPELGSIPADPRFLQEHLQSLFEPGAETSVEPKEDTHNLLLIKANEEMDALFDHMDQANGEIEDALAGSTARVTVTDIAASQETPHVPDGRVMTSLTAEIWPSETLLDSNTGTTEAEFDLPTALSTSVSADNMSVETMLTFKGISEVISSGSPSLMPLEVDTGSDVGRSNGNSGLLEPDLPQLESDASENGDPIKVAFRARNVGIDHIAFGSETSLMGEDETNLARHIAGRITAQTAPVEMSLPEKSEPTQIFGVPVGLTQITTARDRFKACALKDDERDSQPDDDERNSGEESNDKEPGRKPANQSLPSDIEEEQVIKLTRDSSDADRAYALYQRMSGF